MEDHGSEATRSAEDLATYALGRTCARLKAPYKETDRTFASERIDGLTIPGAVYKHCTFINVSFKESKLERAEFLDCIFVGCYFRRSDFRDSSFVGCRFIDCRFPRVAIRSCDFRHANFRGCALPSSEMAYSVPPEPNLREELARNLSIESARLGLSGEAGKYRDVEIRAREAHLWAALLGESTWYREHFDAAARVKSFIVYMGSLLNRWMWGYGERLLVLLRNWVLASFLVFPSIFWLLRAGFKGSAIGVTFSSALIFSLKSAVPAAINCDIVPIGAAVTALSLVESIYSAVTLALVASYVFRWSLHR